MKGYQITFFTQQDRTVKHQPVAEWLLTEARNFGIKGATILSAAEGFGRDRQIHSVHFFELADQPQEVIMAVTEEQMVKFFNHIKCCDVNVFYVMCPIEFGTTIGE